MGRTVSEGLQTSQSIAFGETIELVDGANVVDDLVKANGQILNKADFPELADFVATTSSYTDYNISAKTALFVRPANSVENIIAYNGNFYCFYQSSIDGSIATYWSMSPNGEDWTFPLLVNGSGTFNNVRVLDTSLFIMTSNGTFKFDGVAWTLFNASITQDLAYNGTNLWIGGNALTTQYKSTDGVNWTTATITGNMKSIVWCGINFLRTCGTTTAYYSADGVTWTSSTLPYDHNGHKILYVNGNAIVPLASTKLYCFSTNLTSWTNSGEAYNAGYSISCFYDGTNYWFGYSVGSQQIGKTTSLSTTLTAYGFAASSFNGSAKIAYNGTIMLVAGVTASPNANLAFWASSAFPTTTLNVSNISTSFDTSATGTNVFLGNGYHITDLYFGSTFYSCLRVDDGTGLMKLKRYSSSQIYFQSSAATLTFGHYAKDAGYLYYAITYNTAVTVTYHKVNSTNILETAGTLSNLYLTARPICHTNGFFFTTSTAGQSCSVVGNVNYANTVTVGIDSTRLYVSSDGKDIFSAQAVSPYDAYQSTNYGKSFNQFTPNVYNSAGSSVTITAYMLVMFKLGGMYYSALGVYGGYSPYLLNETKGLATSIGGGVNIQINDNLILRADTNYIGTKSGTATVGLGTGATACGLAYTDIQGNVYILDKTPTNVTKLAKPVLTDATKFKVPNIPSSNNGKANYIKGVK